MHNLQTAYWYRRVTVRAHRDKKEITVKPLRRTISSFLSSYVTPFKYEKQVRIDILHSVPETTWQPLNDVNALNRLNIYTARYFTLKYPAVHSQQFQFNICLFNKT